MPRDRDNLYWEDRVTYDQVVERLRQEREMPQDVNPNAPPPDEGQSDEVYTSPGTERTWRRTYGGGESIATPTRSREPNPLYRTVVDNKIRYKGKVFTARSLKGKLDGKRFYFKHYPSRPGDLHADELMVLLSTAVVHEGSLRGLPDSIMNKFYEENNRLISDRYGDRIYEHWYPIGKKVKEEEPNAEVIVDPIYTYVDEAGILTWDELNVDSADDINEAPRQLTPAEEARETDERVHQYNYIAVGRGELPADNFTILEDHTVMFDDARDRLQRDGRDPSHIVGSTLHYWIMNDGSIINRYTGEATLNRATTPNPVSHSTTLADGSIMTEEERRQLQARGIINETLRRILGSTLDHWIGNNFLVDRHTGEFNHANSTTQIEIENTLRGRGVNL